MQRSTRTKTIAFFLLIVASSLAADAAEIRLKSTAWCQADLVTLGDVAEVIDQDAERAARLAAVPLLPTPAEQRIVSARQIRQILALRSVDLSQCRWTGARAVRLIAHGPAAVAALPLSKALEEKAAQRVEAAILQYVEQVARPDGPLQVDASVDPRWIRLVAAEQNQLAVGGGRPPWGGRQTFQLTVTGAHGRRRFPVSATIWQPELVVVAARPLRRGEVIRAEHLQLIPATPGWEARPLVHDVNDVVGREATRSIQPGQPIEPTYYRAPLLVRRGELVTVVAVASGVRVRTRAMAMEDGSQGDLIMVQSLDKRAKYSARVTALHTAEVFADATRVSPSLSSVSGPDR